MKTSRIIAVALVFCLLLLGVAQAEGSLADGGVNVKVSVDGLYPDDTYTIEMRADKADYPMPAGSSGGVYTLTLNGPGSAKIPAISFEKLGIYTYTIRQLPGASAFAKSYDDTVYTYTVAVTQGEAGKELQAWLSVEGRESKPDECSFVNSYLDPTPVDHDPSVKKTINIVPAGNPDFQFTLTAISNTAGFAPAEMPMSAGAANGVKTVSIKAGEEKEFGALTFSQEGTYVYEIAEVNTQLENVAYDSAVYTLTYVITLNRETWKYEKDLTVSKNGAVVDMATYNFTNDYTPNAASDNTLRVKKVISGDTPGTSANFEFVLTAKSNTVGLGVADMPMPAGASAGKMTVSISGSGEKEFGALTFDQAGTYVYELSEVNAGLANYTYDQSVYTLTYEITLEDGNFSVKKTVAKDGSAVADAALSFTNTYTAPKNGTPKTGVEDYWPYLLGGACVLLLAAAFMVVYLRRTREGK